MAAIGRQLKQSVNVFHSLMLYRRLPENARYQIRDALYRKEPLRTLIVESVNAVDTCAFVIAAENEEVFGVFDLRDRHMSK